MVLQIEAARSILYQAPVTSKAMEDSSHCPNIQASRRVNKVKSVVLLRNAYDRSPLATSLFEQPVN
jgi:hypothetical protein